MHKQALQLFHVCEVALIILYEVTSRKVNLAAISTRYEPYNRTGTLLRMYTHGNLDKFLGFQNHSLACSNPSNSLATQQSNDYY